MTTLGPKKNEGSGETMNGAMPTALKAAFEFDFAPLASSIDQDCEYVDVTFPPIPGRSRHKERIRFHDYSRIYSHLGLYESPFHIRLQCHSPEELVALLSSCIESPNEPFSPSSSSTATTHVQILDIGAGNGIVGQELRLQLQHRIGTLIGTDLLPGARAAALRDRPAVYDDYLVADLLSEDGCEKLVLPLLPGASHGGGGHGYYDVLCICACFGPGWGDMPVRALWNVLRLLRTGGLVAMTVNEKWCRRRSRR